MTSEGEKQCGLSQFLPMSCRGRAEAFARRLHSRLRTLGSQDGDDPATSESSWLASNELSNSVTSLQPRHSVDSSDLFMDFGMLEEPGSPEEEATESEITRFITNPKDDLLHHDTTHHDPKCNGVGKLDLQETPNERSSLDSDSSDGQQYFDPENVDFDTSNHVTSRLNGVGNHIDELPEPDIRRPAFMIPVQACVLPPCDLASSSDTTSTLSMASRSRTISEASRSRTISEGDSLASCSKIESPSELYSEDSESVDTMLRRRTCGWDLHFDPDKFGENNNEFQAIDLENIARFRRNTVTDTDSLSEDISEAVVPLEGDECYCSQLSLSNELTVECPNPITEIVMLEIQDTDDLEESCVDEVPSDVLAFIQPPSPERDELDSLEPVSDMPEENEKEADSGCGLTVKQDDDVDIEVDIEERIPRVRRCSSLKTGKTPPGTPGRKKIVRFADVLGLDLADVRTFMDEIPKIPTSAYDDLSDADLSLSLSDTSISGNVVLTAVSHHQMPNKTLVPLFQQPGGEADFLDKIREFQVCLENAVLQDPVALGVSGTVRVRNLDFNKSVHIRYSTDSWKSFSDLQATYVNNSCDGFSDKFSFTLYVHTLSIGERLEFAVRFHCKGCQYWDNNGGSNYCFQCLPTCTNTPYMAVSSIDHDNWAGASFYYNDEV